MPTKGDTKEMQLTPIKVGAPRTFGENGKAFPITVSEDIPDGFEVYADAGADAIKAILGTTVTFGLEYINQYQGQDKWKIVSVPGWSRGQGGGGRGGRGGWTPRLDHQNQRAEMLVESAYKTAGALAPAPESIDAFIEIANRLADSMAAKANEIAKLLPAPASAPPGGSGTPAGGDVATSPPGSDLRPDLFPELVALFRKTFEATGGDWEDRPARTHFMATTLGPIAEREGWAMPPTDKNLTEMQFNTYRLALENAAPQEDTLG